MFKFLKESYLNKKKNNVYGCFAYMYTQTTCVPGAHVGQKSVSLEMEV